MGQQVVRDEPEGELQHCVEYLRRVDTLLAEPEKLESECDFHFQRAGIDAHGDMRRIELRRVLWTFARHLGSTELTWEAIEAAAVVGTLEPRVPVVTRAEFYRCVLKTVHLVGFELRRRVGQAEALRPSPCLASIVARRLVQRLELDGRGRNRGQGRSA